MTSIPIDLPPSGFSLDDKYTREEGLIFLTGVQALVRLPMDQHRADRRTGLHTATFIAGYRGSPLGVFDLELARQQRLLAEHHIVHSPALNEELGATAVYGSQMAGLFPGAKYDGVHGIWYGKGPGVDRTGDAFRHANTAGAGKNGGVLALGGDDPSSKSSTMPSASEIAFYDALMPVIYPGSVQDILDLGLHGFMLSRVSGLWIGTKIVTNVADGSGTAEVSPERVRPVIPEIEYDGKPFQHQLDWRLSAPHNLEMERSIHYARLEMARAYARENGLNRITVNTPDAWLGIMAAGKTYFDVRQALDELGLDEESLHRYGVRLLKMGMLFPMEPSIVKEFARGLQEILVIEEKRSFMETFAKDILYGLSERPAVLGKFDEEGRILVPAHSELDPDLIARAIAARVGRKAQIPSVEARIGYLDEQQRKASIPLITVARSPYFCSGCPHNTGTTVPEGSIVGAGIGCHTMAFWMDPDRYGTFIGLTQMGAEGSQWVGIAPFTETRHFIQNIGDGTLFHSGGLAVNYAVASGVNITYKILYNSAVAMTGGQDATGMLPVPALTRRLEAEGVKRIIITTDDAEKYRGIKLASIAEVWHRDRIIEAQEELAKIPGVTVLIHDQQCAAEKRRLRKRGKLVDPNRRVYINERVCEGCGDCGRVSNCLSVQPIETEFGRKTQIHQSSCNKDYSCVKGDCPSFVTVEWKSEVGGRRSEVNGTASSALRTPYSALDVPEPKLRVPTEHCSIHMMGIGGTGVVTVSQVLGTAALLDGKHVWGLDQTGLSQKGGPVVSDLKISSTPFETSKVSAGGSDLYLGFDLLVATEQRNLATADPARTIAVVSTSQVPTGKMVADTTVRFPALANAISGIESATRKQDNIYLDAQALSEALFDDAMPANVLLLGAAYQAGAVPVSAERIEAAIRLNGAAVEQNLAAFHWGRLAVHDPKQVEDVVGQRATGNGQRDTVARSLSHAARQLIDESGAERELRRLLEVRVPELIVYQSVGYARRYVQFVRQVAKAEQARTPGRTALAEAVARNLYKLMAYKDEYEVARLHLDAAETAKLHAQFGEEVKVSWNLHPPVLRAMGLKRKIKLGPWFTPGMQALRSMKVVRGTPFDVFGRAEVRRVERELPLEYRRMVRAACATLTPENHSDAVALAELPDMVRGYEEIKLENVRRYREAARERMAKLGISGAA